MNLLSTSLINMSEHPLACATDIYPQLFHVDCILPPSLCRPQQTLLFTATNGHSFYWGQALKAQGASSIEFPHQHFVFYRFLWSIHWNAFETVICELAAISSRGRWANGAGPARIVRHSNDSKCFLQVSLSINGFKYIFKMANRISNISMYHRN